MKRRSPGLTACLFFLFSACAILFVASRSSFLYPLNNWDDANSYFSMGKALFSGRLLYRDVFDQKGPYLYFFYGLAYLISHTTFAGVFLLELILGFFDILGFYRILRLYLSHGTAVALAPVSFALLCASRSFWWGGAAEEICLPFLVWGLYLSLSYFQREYGKGVMPLKTVLLGGILAGFIANIKFTLLGFFFAWMMCAGFSYLGHKDLLGGIRACFVFLFGMFLPFVPWLVYFGIRHGLYDWYWGYVYVNVFVYNESGAMEGGIPDRIYTLAKLLYNLMLANKPWFVPVIPGLIYAFLHGGQKFLARLTPLLLFGFLFLGIFIGGRELPYYVLPLSVFTVTGVALAGRIGEKLFQIREDSVHLVWGILLTVCLTAFVFLTSMNVPFMKQKKEDFFLFRFRDEILAEKEDPTLLNVGCLDAGLYTLCDIVPNCRYFQTQTWHTEDPGLDPYAEQDRYLAEGLTDYVLVRGDAPEVLFDRYELMDSEEYGWDGLSFTYSLYRKVR